MAVLYLGIDIGGANPEDVAVDSSTTSKDVELAIDDTNLAAGGVGAKDQVYQAVEAIMARLQQQDY